MVRPTSAIPGTAATRATRSGSPFRTRGSPPVSRTLSMQQRYFEGRVQALGERSRDDDATAVIARLQRAVARRMGAAHEGAGA